MLNGSEGEISCRNLPIRLRGLEPLSFGSVGQYHVHKGLHRSVLCASF